MLSIELLPGQTPRTANAEIIIGGHKETAEVPLQYWRRDRYRKQWHDALQGIASGKLTGCLITAMYDPRSANFLMWWPMWRVGDTVFVQNQILFMDKIREGFDEEGLERYIPKRTTTTSEGERISEWSVSVKDIVVPKADK
ncbi:MAG: hypothetical protein COV48_09675 [Elusimicrobia bacterium CG11_big_fil_rev_8_21_14_0_20_64_6]|nr:MAG: hypothetical protein COV48_09675 [Elusimicrobia bacterium CG11_big_fil_rev_8_21_14_0_20_64_6]